MAFVQAMGSEVISTSSTDCVTTWRCWLWIYQRICTARKVAKYLSRSMYLKRYTKKQAKLSITCQTSQIYSLGISLKSTLSNAFWEDMFEMRHWTELQRGFFCFLLTMQVDDQLINYSQTGCSFANVFVNFLRASVLACVKIVILF